MQTLNALVNANAAEKSTSRFLLVNNMAQSSFTLLDNPLPEDGSTRSIVASTSIEDLGPSTGDITSKLIESGVMSEKTLEDMHGVAALLFGILDERSNDDQTMLLVKEDYDFSADTDTEPESSEPEDELLGFHTMRIRFKGAAGTFDAFQLRNLPEIKDNPDSCDEHGVYWAY